MEKLELLPNHKLERVCDALNLLEFFEKWRDSVYEETLEGRNVVVPKWQTMADVQLAFARALIARAQKAMERKTISEEYLKLLSRNEG